MLRKKNKNGFPVFKTVLFFFLLFSCTFITAQDDEKKEKYFLEKSQYAEMTDSIHLRQVPGTVVKKMQEDDDYWYANTEVKKKKINEQNISSVPFVRRQWFQNLLWIIIITGFVGFVIWWLAGNKVALFRKKIRRIDDIRQDELESEDIFSINYQKEIDKATQQGNYRLAVRLMFLRLLKNLTEKNIIQYKQGKTNFDYLLQLQPTRYYRDFFRITRNYEYSWYGQFEVDERAYYVILDDFKNFDRLLK